MKKLFAVAALVLSVVTAPALFAGNKSDSAPAPASSNQTVERSLSAIQKQLAELKSSMLRMMANMTGEQSQGMEMNSMMLQHCEGMMGQMMSQRHSSEK